MTDVEAVVRAFLAGQTGLTALVGERVWAGPHVPPGYTPGGDGPGVLMGIRGGPQEFHSRVLRVSMQFRCYAETARLARQVDRALYDVLNDCQVRHIKWARLEQVGQLVTEPSTEWYYVLSFYTILVSN